MSSAKDFIKKDFIHEEFVQVDSRFANVWEIPYDATIQRIDEMWKEHWSSVVEDGIDISIDIVRILVAPTVLCNSRCIEEFARETRDAILAANNEVKKEDVVLT